MTVQTLQSRLHVVVRLLESPMFSVAAVAVVTGLPWKWRVSLVDCFLGEEAGLAMMLVQSESGASERLHWSMVDLWSDGLEVSKTGPSSVVAHEKPLMGDEDRALQESERVRVAQVAVDTPIALSRGMDVGVVSTATEHAELLAYLAAQTGWSFHLARLACMFQEGAGERFRRARLVIALRGEDDKGVRPIAWSLAPDKLLGGEVSTRNYALRANARFASAEISEQRAAPQETIMQSSGLLTSKPEWEFTPAKGAPLRGDFALMLIVKAPAATRVRGEVAFDVVVTKHRTLARDKQATVKGATTVTIDFEGPGQQAGYHS
ncbi:hypothetical protein [Streptomyces sp. NPDC058424]|uniref:hypothetical protein n=1 Tax=Streptomyces sp. NPDC058424 TaxID=3346491 RepID=UPI003648A3D4